jgi:hypothetical protein
MEVESKVFPEVGDGAAWVLYHLREDVAADQMLRDMMLLIKFSKTHGDKAAEHFKEIYATEEGQIVNAARRRVDMLYDTVRVFVEEWGVIPPSCVSDIMEPGSVDSFLKWVNPLSVGKPSPKATIYKQEAFWKKFGTGVAPSIIDHV